MSGKSSQAKGRRAEIELSKILQGYGYDVRPGEPLNYGKEPDITGLPLVHCECKRSEKLHLHDWLLQATADAQKFGDGWPTIFHRRNREGWNVIMPLESWLQLYARATSCKCGGHCREGSYQPPKDSNHEG